jgi:aspartate racemase
MRRSSLQLIRIWMLSTRLTLRWAASGIVTEAQRKVFNTVSERLLHTAGAQAIMLGGTDLALAFNEKDTGFPIVDCAGIHADAITRLAIPGGS